MSGVWIPQFKYGCLILPAEVWQEASREVSWLLDLADNAKELKENKEKATPVYDSSLLAFISTISNVVFLVF